MLFKKMKRTSVLLLAALLLGAAFAMVTVACGGGDDAAGGTTNSTPVLGDYNITGLNPTYDGTGKMVSIVAQGGKSPGAITIHYEGSGDTTFTKVSNPSNTTAPKEVGTYAVTFDVAAASGWNAASDLNAGTLTISATGGATPVTLADFDITGPGTESPAGTWTVTADDQPQSLGITAKPGKSDGAMTITYTEAQGSVITVPPGPAPSLGGTYAVTFSVAQTSEFAAGGPFNAGTLIIQEAETDYSSELGGISFTPVTLGLQPGDTTAQIRLNWYSTGAPSNKVAQVKFVRGTFVAGKELLVGADGSVDTAGTNTQHKVSVTGLRPGASYQYAVSNDGTNWSPVYDFKVPAATGAFRFAVVADPQLTVGNVDVNSRYPAGATMTTAAGWLETMAILVQKEVSFIAFGGDQVDASGGNENEYNNFFAPPGLRSIPFAPVSGNHDNHTNFAWHYNLPNVQSFTDETVATAKDRNYFYLYNNILFVGLNTAPYPTSNASPSGNKDVPAATQHVARFRSTIQEAKTVHAGNYDWLIVHHHKSTASVANHIADKDIQAYVEAGFEKLMSDEGVDFVLAGHDHVYARSYPLRGLDGGAVSMPNTDFPAASGSTWSNIPTGQPVYLTFTTGSGLKYYHVSKDTKINYTDTIVSNTEYPYLGVLDQNGTLDTTMAGSAKYQQGNLPVSNAAFEQPYIPSYCIVDVNGKTITFSTYAIKAPVGQSPIDKALWNYDPNEPYDKITVTKN